MAKSKSMRKLLTPFFVLLAASIMAQGNISIVGNGYSFSVSDPFGWVRDMRNAENMFANVLYYPNGNSPSSQTTMILATLKKKTKDGLPAMMEDEMSSYMVEKPNVKYKVMELQNPQCGTNTQLAYVEGDFYHYVCYLDPGEGYKHGLSIALMVPGREATVSEMETYKEIVAQTVVHFRE